jgi:hypothetical protein
MAAAVANLCYADVLGICLDAVCSRWRQTAANSSHLCCCGCDCSNGDVAWEAQVSTACLAKSGLRWDQQTQAIVKDTNSNTAPNSAATSSTGPGCITASTAATAAPAGTDDSAAAAFEGFNTGNSSSTDVERKSRTAVPADAPAGEEATATAAAAAAAPSVATLAAAAALAQAVATHAPPVAANGPVTDNSGGSGGNVRHVKISPAKPTTVTYDAAADVSAGSSVQPLRDAKALLLELFANFPTACLDMIETTEASTILEGPVLTRAARQMPACMGRGGVVVLGEAAHPVRPSGERGGMRLRGGWRCYSNQADVVVLRTHHSAAEPQTNDQVHP